MMTLHISFTSPYVRKVRVFAREAGIDSQISEVVTVTSDPKSNIRTLNPLGKIPALLVDGGEVLYDSRVICEYLDSLHSGISLFPAAGGVRWTALRRQALADGMMDATVHCYLESLRAAEKRDPGWVAAQEQKVIDSLASMEEEADQLTGPDIGSIAYGCALGYLDLRATHLDWRGRCPTLAGWHADFSKRPSMDATKPPLDA